MDKKKCIGCGKEIKRQDQTDFHWSIKEYCDYGCRDRIASMKRVEARKKERKEYDYKKQI